MLYLIAGFLFYILERSYINAKRSVDRAFFWYASLYTYLSFLLIMILVAFRDEASMSWAIVVSIWVWLGIAAIPLIQWDEAATRFERWYDEKERWEWD